MTGTQRKIVAATLGGLAALGARRPVRAGQAAGHNCKVAVDSLRANTWVPVKPRYVGAPAGGRHFPMRWNNKGAYDPASGCVVVMDRWADKVRSDTIYANAAMSYDPATNTCRVIKLCNWKKERTRGGGYRTVALPANDQDPTPIPRHPMGCLVLVPELKSLYLVNGLNQTGPVKHPADTWKLDLASGKWLLAPAKYKKQLHPPNPSMGHVMEYDPDARLIVYFGSRHAGGHELWTYDPQTNKWKAGARNSAIRTGSAGITYDSRRKLIVLLRGEKLRTYSTRKKEWKTLAPPPRKVGAPGFSYDSKNDILLATTSRKGEKTAATLIYEPKTDKWKELAGSTLPAESRWSSVTYAPKHDVFVFQGGTWKEPKWMLFRYRYKRRPAKPAGK